LRVLVLNAGSSSLKTSVIDAPGDVTISSAELERPAAADWTPLLARTLAEAGEVAAVGHRVVHGGDRRAAIRLDSVAVAELEALRTLAPLHNGPALEVIEASRRALPDVPQVACFDTAFHASLEPAAYVYPLPYAWYQDWGIRRYGFHGLSVAWAVEQAALALGRQAADLALVVAHLGSGCSVTAVEGGRSVDTSMGMTPLEGLMMGTRAGSVDPGVLLGVLADKHMDLAALDEALQHRAGLLGVSGVAADLREVQHAADAGHQRARLAIEIFVRRAAAGIAAAATTLTRLDALVFTGGIGENAGGIRDAICARLKLLGVPQVVPVLVVHAREDIVIARAVARLLAT
jgi:acetate kinase